MNSSLPLRPELARRQNHTIDLLRLFKERPLTWIGWMEIAKVAGSCAWRTRISDVRKIVKKRGGNIEWNRKNSSAYRYVPYVPLSRDAAMPTQQKSLW